MPQTTARGLEPAMGYYGLLDRTPIGRNGGEAAREQILWLRRHDEYPPRASTDSGSAAMRPRRTSPISVSSASKVI